MALATSVETGRDAMELTPPPPPQPVPAIQTNAGRIKKAFFDCIRLTHTPETTAKASLSFDCISVKGDDTAEPIMAELNSN